MSHLQKQLVRIEKIRSEVRQSLDYQLESAKLAFSEAILERLETLGLTRTELARRTGVSVPYITKILRGSTNFTLDSMIRIADALDCDFVQELRPGERKAIPAKPRAQGIRKAPRLRSRRSAPQRPTPAVVHESVANYGKKENPPGKRS